MSRTFDLVDDDARTRLWVAQGWPPHGLLTFYSGEHKTMEALRKMLQAGIGHRFRFLETSEVPDGYRDLLDAEGES